MTFIWEVHNYEEVYFTADPETAAEKFLMLFPSKKREIFNKDNLIKKFKDLKLNSRFVHSTVKVQKHTLHKSKEIKENHNGW